MEETNLCREYMENHGTRVKKSNRKGSVISARAILGSISILQSKPLYAPGIIGTLKSMAGFFQTKKQRGISKLLNLNGLANELGITKEGVIRLIWLLEDARSTNNGSEVYSSETILRVKNALLKERILKQTTTRLDSPLLWMKKESQPTSRRWCVKDYGIKIMVEPYVKSATVA